MAKFCKKCGAQLADEAVFCPNCGTSQAPEAAQPQYAQPQYQPRSGPSIFAGTGFRKDDFKFNPVKEVVAGDVSRYSIFALCLTLFAFFLSIIDVFKQTYDYGWGAAGSVTGTMHAAAPTALKVFLILFMIIFIAAVVWLMFKMFLKKANFLDLLILGCATFLWFLINMIGMIVVGSESSGTVHLTFAGVFFYIVVFAAMAACILPLIFKVIRKK